ncbi:MAG: NUDIX hydrolase [Rhodococcus sp. (in: high G+C Gram-positive bacteria)]
MEQSSVSVDVVALRFGNPEPGALRYGVAPRRWEPYTGKTALPGVLLGAGERLDTAARRAVTTKLGIPDTAILAAGQLTVFDEPSRDPRGPTLSIAMWAVVTADDIATDPAVATEWRGFDEHRGLAFDHDRIVGAARSILAAGLLWRDTTFTRALLGPEFAATHAVAVTTALAGSRPDPGNLNRTLKAIPGLERTDERVRVQATGRPAVVWRWTTPSATPNPPTPTPGSERPD